MHAHEAGHAFGSFQKYMSDFGGDRLLEVIPDFHNTPYRFKECVTAIEKDALNRAKKVAPEIDFVLQREKISAILFQLQKEGKIPERIAHNDAKLNNVLFNVTTGKCVCVIDLDTVMPGLVLNDFGDLVRTAACSAVEDERDLRKIYLDLDLFEALTRGYLGAASDFLTSLEIEYLPFAGKLITFETGLRFLTDYLNGDKYFKIHYQDHNLDRSRNQFKLMHSIEEREEQMAVLVEAITK